MEANRRERHGAGKNVYGNMVTKDPQKFQLFCEFCAFNLECPWEHRYERFHGFGNSVVSPSVRTWLQKDPIGNLV